MKEKFVQLLQQTLEIKDRQINLSDNFRDYAEWDSLNFLSVIAMIDEEFGIIIEGSDFERLKTVEDLVSEVEKRIANR